MEEDRKVKTVVFRWMCPILALALFGPLLAIPVSGLKDPTGGNSATLILSSTPVIGVLALVALVVVAGLGGAVTARVAEADSGRTFVGLCAGWMALRTAGGWDMLRIHGDGAVMPLVIEGVLVAIAAGLLAAVLTIGGGTRTAEAFKADLKVAVGSGGAVVGILIGIAGGVVGSLLVAIDGSRGQCLAGGFAGSVLAAVAVQLATPTLNGEQARLRAMAAVCGLMVVSPLAMLVVPGGSNIAAGARMGTLIGPGIVQPIDWLVGIFLGIPWGLKWVGSVAERNAPQPARRAATN